MNLNFSTQNFIIQIFLVGSHFICFMSTKPTFSNIVVTSDNTDHYHISIEMKHSELVTSFSNGVHFAQQENQGCHEMRRFALKSKRMNRQHLINVINAALDLIEDFDVTPAHTSKDGGHDNSR